MTDETTHGPGFDDLDRRLATLLTDERLAISPPPDAVSRVLAGTRSARRRTTSVRAVTAVAAASAVGGALVAFPDGLNRGTPASSAGDSPCRSFIQGTAREGLIYWSRLDSEQPEGVGPNRAIRVLPPNQPGLCVLSDGTVRPATTEDLARLGIRPEPSAPPGPTQEPTEEPTDGVTPEPTGELTLVPTEEPQPTYERPDEPTDDQTFEPTDVVPPEPTESAG